MNLYMIELSVADWPLAVAWYRDTLGLKLLNHSETDRFALFEAGATRLALKQMEKDTPNGTGVLLAFEVSNLDAELNRLAGLGIVSESPVKISPEGYRQAIIRDPDGYRLCLFEWTVKR